MVHTRDVSHEPVHDSPLRELLAEAKATMMQRLAGRSPRVGIILGSGLGDAADQVSDALVIRYEDVAGMSRCSATSHKGQWVSGTWGGKEVLVMQGRFHGYEGLSAQQVAFPVWLMHELGVEILITTNAAGAINENYAVGDFCAMCDHINLTGRNPIVGEEPDGVAPRFFSMYEAYDPRLRALAQRCAHNLGIILQEGVYLGLLGPSFETAAEIRAFRTLGADTVAMSVVEEVIAARHVGMRVFGMSLVTNMACGIENANPTDEEVLDVGRQKVSDFCALMSSLLEAIVI